MQFQCCMRSGERELKWWTKVLCVAWASLFWRWQWSMRRSLYRTWNGRTIKVERKFIVESVSARDNELLAKKGEEKRFVFVCQQKLPFDHRDMFALCCDAVVVPFQNQTTQRFLIRLDRNKSIPKLASNFFPPEVREPQNSFSHLASTRIYILDRK